MAGSGRRGESLAQGLRAVLTGMVRQEGVRQCGQRGPGGEGRVAATVGLWGGQPLVSGKYSLGQGVGQSLGAQGRGAVEGAVCGPLSRGRVHEPVGHRPGGNADKWRSARGRSGDPWMTGG